ncbi:MAG: PilW family protein, partial [Candidatus Rifleibacteriota bacterium]
MLSKRISGFSLVEICIAAVILLVVLLGASLFWRSSNIQTYHHELRLSFEEKWQRMTALLKQDLRSARHLDAD